MIAKQTIKPLFLLFISALLLMVGFRAAQHNEAAPVMKHNTKLVVQANTSNLTGSWKMIELRGKEGNKLPAANVMKIVTNKHFTIAYFDHQNKKFIGTEGGTYTSNNGKYTETLEFNTLDSTKVGSSITYTYTLKNNKLYITGNKDGVKTEQVWERADEGKKQASPLAGTWRITGRVTPEGETVTMQRGPRKTIKVLSDNRFQWIAYNTATKQFSGTGGGTYTAESGKYTETIEFFSRDPKRVGAQLSFDFETKGDNWHHSGLSSTGNRINEIWSKED